MPGEYIAVLGIIAVFGSGIIITGIIVYAVIRNSRLRHAERLEMIRSGKVLPADWEKSVKPKGRTMFWGIIFTGFGAGLQIIQGFDFFADMFRGRLFRYNDAFDYFGGMIFLGIGLALVYYTKYYQKQYENNGQEYPVSQGQPQKAVQSGNVPQTGEGI